MLKKVKELIFNNNAAYFMRKRIFALLFTALLMAYFVCNMMHVSDILSNDIEESAKAVVSGNSTLKKAVATIDTDMQEEIVGRMNFVETFSYVQNILDKREINNFSYIKDETGSLHYASFFREDDKNCFEYAMRVKRLKDYANAKGCDVIFVVAPSKYVSDDGRLLEDMPVNDPQVLVDETLFYLNRLGVETLDLNKYIPNEEVPYEEAFFKTDHHWTIPAAFCATRILANTLNERFDYDLDVDTYTDPDNFYSVTYPQGMLGSMGRSTGAAYSGLDDMTAIYPKFKMDFSRHTLEENGRYSDRKGDIIGTLILPEVLNNDDIYKDSQYSVYLNGLRVYESVKNESNPDGKKLFMIRDSYFSPVISFLSPMVSQIDAMWSLEESDQINIENYIMENDFDCIVVEMYPYNIGDDAFQFFIEEE